MGEFEIRLIRRAYFGLPIVSIVVPFLGLTKSTLRILKGNPKKNYNGDYRYDR